MVSDWSGRARNIPNSLQDIFKKIDTNGNGLISKQEMVVGMQS